MNQACPIPGPKGKDERIAIGKMLAGKRVAVVGLSNDPGRASHSVAQYLKTHGYEIIPINPKYENVLGVKCYGSLKDAPGKIDVVNVFRRSEFCDAVVEEAIAAGAKGVWLQAGIRNAQAKKRAADAGIDYVEDRCMMVEHMRR